MSGSRGPTARKVERSTLWPQLRPLIPSRPGCGCPPGDRQAISGPHTPSETQLERPSWRVHFASTSTGRHRPPQAPAVNSKAVTERARLGFDSLSRHQKVADRPGGQGSEPISVPISGRRPKHGPIPCPERAAGVDLRLSTNSRSCPLRDRATIRPNRCRAVPITVSRSLSCWCR